MPQRLRSRLAALAGAAVLTSGVGLSAVTVAAVPAASAARTPIDLDIAEADLRVPPAAERRVGFTVKIDEPAGDNPLIRVTATLLRAGRQEGDPAAWTPVALSPAPPEPVSDAEPLAVPLGFTGSFKIFKHDRGGAWKLRILAVRADGEESRTFSLPVRGGPRADFSAVSPAKVRLRSGADVQVVIIASVKGATDVYAELHAKNSSMYVTVPLSRTRGGYHRGVSRLADNATPGGWRLSVHARRNEESAESPGMTFTVLAPVHGVAAKTASSVTVRTPAKARAGRAFTIYGKVYRGKGGYRKKLVELRFKKRGSASFKLAGFARANSAGRWRASVRQRADGYWRVVVPGASRTKGSYATSRVVTMR